MNDIQRMKNGGIYILCRTRQEVSDLATFLLAQNVKHSFRKNYAEKRRYLVGMVDGKFSLVDAESAGKKEVIVFYPELVVEQVVGPKLIITAETDMKMTEVWVEGYDATDGPRTATFYGKYIAETLREAVEYAVRAGTMPRMFTNMENLTFGGHKICDNEKEARAKHG